MQAELAALFEYVHKLMLVEEIVTFHIIGKMPSFRLLETHPA